MFAGIQTSEEGGVLTALTYDTDTLIIILIMLYNTTHSKVRMK